MAASAPAFLMETAYLQGTCVRLEELFKSLPAPFPQWETTPNEPSLLFVSFCFVYKDLRLLRSPGGLKFRLHMTTVNLVSYARLSRSQTFPQRCLQLTLQGAAGSFLSRSSSPSPKNTKQVSPVPLWPPCQSFPCHGCCRRGHLVSPRPQGQHCRLPFLALKNHVASADGRERRPEQPQSLVFASGQGGFTDSMCLNCSCAWQHLQSYSKRGNFLSKGFNPAQ